MASRSVLLCYLENKKALKLPPKSGIQDLSYLNNEFLTNFFLIKREVKIYFSEIRQNVGGDIDLDESDEIFDKYKLKVVVTPMLHSAASSVATFGSDFEKVLTCKF